MLSHRWDHPNRPQFARRTSPSSASSAFSNLIEEFLSPSGFNRNYGRSITSSAVFDVVQKIDEENDTAVIHMFVPGLSQNHVDVSVNALASIINIVINVEQEANVVGREVLNEVVNQIYAERYQRSFRMGSDYDVEHTIVDLNNGILTLTTPRVEKSPQSVKLPINTEIVGSTVKTPSGKK